MPMEYERTFLGEIIHYVINFLPVPLKYCDPQGTYDISRSVYERLG